jgi:F-type H+-transporting ATPase subunit alpha
VARFARFGTEIDDATRRQIRRGERLRAALTQPVHRTRSLAAQVVLLWAATEGYLDDLRLEDIPAFETALVDRFETEHPAIFLEIEQTGELPAETNQALVSTIAMIHQEASGTASGPAAQTDARGERPRAQEQE